jgi:hypothetical protein
MPPWYYSLTDCTPRRVGDGKQKMSLVATLVAKPPPLRLDETGTLRVGNTRVPIDTIVSA